MAGLSSVSLLFCPYHVSILELLFKSFFPFFFFKMSDTSPEKALQAWALTGENVVLHLEANTKTGLTPSEASSRLASSGRNELEQKKGVQPVKIFIEQIFNAMTLVLLLALAASFGIRAWIEGGILGGIIILNIFIGFFQTLQAEKTINSLQSLGLPRCNVYRDGQTVNIQTSEVVPGDIVDLNTGDSVPADIRLLEAVNLEADEALLTGESAPVSKRPEMVFDHDTGPGDRLNVVFSSTTITKGRGRGVVFATGMETEIGTIAKALQDDGRSKRVYNSWWKKASMAVYDWLGEFLGLTVGTLLQKKLSQLFVCLFGFAIICAIIVLGANKFETHIDVILYAVTTAIGTIPVSLLLVLTVTMAAGTKKMLERHVIVRNLQSLEALGGVTNVCSDKTGTITQGRMVVREAWIAGVGTYSVQTGNEVYNPEAGEVSFSPAEPKEESEKGRAIIPTDETGNELLKWYLHVASLANLATVEEIDGEWKGKGAPTEIAVEVFASRFGWTRNGSEWQHVAEYPFDSDVKRMSVVFKTSSQTHAFTKVGSFILNKETCTNKETGSC